MTYDYGFWACVYDYQTLIAGTFALLGGAGVYYAARHNTKEIKASEVREQKRIAMHMASGFRSELTINGGALHNYPPDKNLVIIFHTLFYESTVKNIGCFNDELISAIITAYGNIISFKDIASQGHLNAEQAGEIKDSLGMAYVLLDAFINNQNPD